jgi:hypothetical protein
VYDKLLKPRQTFLITLYIIPSIILAQTDDGLVKSRGTFCWFFVSHKHCVRRVFIGSLERLMLISKGFIIIIIIIRDLKTVLKMFKVAIMT